jgi:signal transduction histidine kinase
MPRRQGDPRKSSPDEALCWCTLLCGEDDITGAFQERRPAAGDPILTRSLAGLFESGGLIDLLETVRASGVARGWETRIHYREDVRKILLHGFRVPQGILVFASLVPRSATLRTDRSAGLSPAKYSGTREDREDIVNLFEIAHDLLNPISSIISACEYLATSSKDNLDPEQAEMIAGIGSSAATLLRLSRWLSECTRPGS